MPASYALYQSYVVLYYDVIIMNLICLIFERRGKSKGGGSRGAFCLPPTKFYFYNTKPCNLQYYYY
jgi:hypothetical protein